MLRADLARRRCENTRDVISSMSSEKPRLCAIKAVGRLHATVFAFFPRVERGISRYSHRPFRQIRAPITGRVRTDIGSRYVAAFIMRSHASGDNRTNIAAESAIPKLKYRETTARRTVRDIIVDCLINTRHIRQGSFSYTRNAAYSTLAADFSMTAKSFLVVSSLESPFPRASRRDGTT